MSTLHPYDNAPRLPDVDPLDPRVVFGSADGRLELEVGPGRGGFIFERLESTPNVRIIGLEIRRKWATIVDARLAKRGYGARGRVFAEDAKLVLPTWAPESLSAVFINFPDPWWKKRHDKRRVITDRFLADIARVLVPSGELFIQTDVPERATLFEALIEAEPRLQGLGLGGTLRVDENPYSAKSPRERRAEADGLPIFRLRCRRR